MKAYLHIFNDYEFCHEAVCAEIEIEAVPRIGETFWMDAETQGELEDAAIAFYNTSPARKKLAPYGKTYLYTLESREPEECVDFDDFNYVHGILWKADADGIYRPHIELSDKE